LSWSTLAAGLICRFRSEKAWWLPLVAGIGLTAGAVLLARNRIETARRDVLASSRPVDVVVASRPIRMGEPFSVENLARKPVPASGAGKRNVPASEFDLLLNASSKGDIDTGDPVLWTDVEEPFEAEGFSLAVPRGSRAVTLEAGPTSSFAGLVRTGDRVDFLCKTSDRWFRDVRILAVDRHYSRAGKSGAEEVSTLTLSVSAEEGARLAACAQDGTLLWFLRNPVDNDVVPLARPRNPVRKVEVWKGGIPVADSRVAEAFR
jgi:Flp pilus assembly protein CpaB